MVLNWIDICQDMIKLDSIPKWRIIKRKNMKLIIDEHNKHIDKTDIFMIADEAFKYAQARYGDEHSISYMIEDQLNFKITLYGCGLEIIKGNWVATFMPRMNRFEIHTPDISYTVYKSTTIPKVLEKSWEDIYEELREILINLLIDINMSRLLRSKGGFAIGESEYIYRTDSDEEEEEV